MTPDAELVKAALNGDVQAFSILVEKYSSAACSVAFGVLGDYHLAQDAAQEAFVRAYFKLETLKESERFGSWLYAITYRLSLDWLRKQQKERQALESAEANKHRDSFEEMVETRAIHNEVWAALTKLDEKNRIIVSLFHMSEWTMESIGGFLNMTVAAVESRLRRARKVIKQEMLAGIFGEMFDQSTNQTITTKVTQRIVKQMGQFYIPVTHKANTTAWFMELFGLTLDQNGHLWLPSGQTLFLLQANSVNNNLVPDTSAPVLTFEVDNSLYVYDILMKQGIRIEEQTEEYLNNKYFFFYDLDNNKFGIHQS
jgi:RNA polymerase sigma-70 factor (ECF subfamily)